jgi:acyl carrier protein
MPSVIPPVRNSRCLSAITSPLWVLIVMLLLSGCGQKAGEKPIERTVSGDKYVQPVLVLAAKVLNTQAAKLDVNKPLLDQGADELDVVELVMLVEEEFDIEIPDEELEERNKEPIKNLNIKKIALAVAKQKQKKPSRRTVPVKNAKIV